MQVSFVGGTLNGQQRNQAAWCLTARQPIYEGRIPVVSHDGYFAYSFPVEVYKADPKAGVYRYSHSEAAQNLT